MAVQHNILSRSLTAFYNIDYQRVHSGRLDDSACEAHNFQGLYPLVNAFHSLLYEAICLILLVDHRGEIGHTDELLESLDEERLELAVDERCQLVSRCFYHICIFTIKKDTISSSLV